MHSLFLAPLAPFFKLNLARDKLFVLTAPVIDTLALGTCEFDESFL